MQACKSFGFVWLVVRDRFHDREVFLKQLIRLPICHDEVANEAITDTHSLKHFVAGNQQKTLMKLVLQVASIDTRAFS